MNRLVFDKKIVLLAGLLAGLGGCGTPGSLAQKRYDAAIAVEGSGDLDRAEQLYRQLVSDFPRTEEAADAGRQLERIGLRRAQLQKEQFMPVLHRIRKVVNSFREMTGRVPRTLADFDRADFPFSSEHLAQLVPPGFTAYLQLSQGQENFFVHALQDGSDTGYRVDRYSPVLQPVIRAELEGRLNGELTVAERKGNLILIRRR